METIEITVTGSDAKVTKNGVVVSGTVGLPVAFSFDEAWDGLQKTAVFRVNGKSLDRVNIADTTTVPWELLQKPGCRLFVGIYGTNADGSLQIPTLWADLGVIQPGADPSGDESADPTLPVWAQTVLYTPQSRTEEEKAQARRNIGVDGVIPSLSGTSSSPVLLYNLEPGVYNFIGYYKAFPDDKTRPTLSCWYQVIVAGTRLAVKNYNRVIYIFDTYGCIDVVRYDYASPTRELQINANSVIDRTDLQSNYVKKIDFRYDGAFTNLDGDQFYGYITEDETASAMVAYLQNGGVLIGRFKDRNGQVVYSAVGTLDRGEFNDTGYIRISFGALHHEICDGYQREGWEDDAYLNELWTKEEIY